MLRRTPEEEAATQRAIALEQQRPRKVRKPMAAIVYFMRVPSGFVKIGHTNELERRWRTVQTCQHEKVTIVAAFFADTRVEQDILWELRDLCVRGEWHRDDPRIAAVIKRLSGSKRRAHGRSRASMARVLRVHSSGAFAMMENGVINQ